MNKNELMKDGVVALVRYTGSLQGYTHTNPRTRNTVQFAGPNVPAKIYDLADAEFYAGKEAFEVELLVSDEDEAEVPLVSDEPVDDKEDKEEDEEELQDEHQDDDEIVEPVKEEKKTSKSKPKEKSKPKGGNK